MKQPHIEELFEQARLAAAAGAIWPAMAQLEDILLRDPSHAKSWQNHCAILLKMRNNFAAMMSADRAIACDPSNVEHHNNKGVALLEMGRLELALDVFLQAAKINPTHEAILVNEGNTLRLLKREREAISCYERAIAAKPDSILAHYNMSLALMAVGDYRRGFEEYEWRWKTGSLGVRKSTHKQWNGEPLGRNDGLLIFGEQAFGDVMQFMRFAPAVKQRWPKAKVYLEVRPSLARLARSLPGIDGICPLGENVPKGITQTVALLSLPRVLGITLDTLPADVPYLFANADATKIWRESLEHLPGLKVGLCWAGQSRPNQPASEYVDRRRSMMLSAFAPLAGMASFVSLMHSSNLAAQQILSPPNGMSILDCGDSLDDWLDTAALVSALDLVICVDTATAHLAGAMGKPVWLLSRFDSCWRWLENRSDSPWYPTVRIFRQPKFGDWSSVIKDVGRALREKNGAAVEKTVARKSNTPAKLKLPDVTLVALDTVAHELTRMAIADCVKAANFADVLFFSNKPVSAVATIPIDGNGVEFVQRAIWYEVPKHVKTSHFLLIQWDSWIINPRAWCDEYLEYDYIGAPWHWHKDGLNVGNGGFSLRSTRLAHHVAEHEAQYPLGGSINLKNMVAEDDTLCRRYRRRLEGEGFRWAPASLASIFSSEHSWSDFSFGFHAMFNWPKVLTEAQIDERLEVAAEYVLTSPQYASMREVMRSSKAA